ncbi:MAG: D-aminoacyl-tRNA deacylase [Pseudomonadota bacterium]
MRLLLQRVHEASVSIDGKKVAAVGAGLLVLVGFGHGDTLAMRGSAKWQWMIDKMLDLRIFPDGQQRMNLSLRDVATAQSELVAQETPNPMLAGEVLLVSQFTLYADCKKGRRPSFSEATPPQEAKELFECFVHDVRSHFSGRVDCGVFGADMDVHLVNWGPVTIMLDSDA